MSKKIHISVTNDLATDQRVQKVATTLINMGFEVFLVGRLLPNSLPVNSFKNHRFKLFFNKGVAFYAEYHIRLFFFLLFKKYDVLLANDLDTLLPNYLLSKIKNCELVYDSHEYYTEVPELQQNPIKKKIWTAVEAFIFPKLKHCYTVNDSIATIYQQKYGVNVLVVKNVPSFNSNAVYDKIALRKKLQLPLESKIVIMQGAGINIDRGGEEAVAAMQFLSNTILLVVGAGDAIPILKLKVVELGLENIVFFKAKLPYQQMLEYTAAADIGLTLDKDTNLNYRYSLPNKIFDYFKAGLPLVASNLIEIKKVHDAFPFGILLNKVSAKDIAEAITKMAPASAEYLHWQQQIRLASEVYCWENEERTLDIIYKQFL